ncbi:MAG: hypothetical protein IJU16_07740 [Clostridia bacterium]|nr:hypothetical protein [Clostridia bacterium]
MKKRFSFGQLLYHDKLMMIVSLAVAIVIWALVLTGPSNVSERSIPVKVTVDLTNSYVYQSGLRVIGNAEFDVRVNVSGVWSVISRLSDSDFRVRPDLSAITGPGDVELSLSVSRNSIETDYDILSVTPNTVTIVCDYWEDGTSFEVETDLSKISVSDPDHMQLGEAVIDKTAFPDGRLTVEGPKTVVDKIASLVARVPDEETIADIKQYEVEVLALDASGSEIDIADCSFKEITGKTVNLTVPVWVERTIPLSYTIQHAPSGYDLEEILSIEPKEIRVLGAASELEELAELLKDIGTVDFAELSLSKPTQTFDLDLPSTVRLVEGATEATVTLDTENMSEKALDLTVTADMVTIQGEAGSKTVTVAQQKLNDLLLVGNEASIEAITASDLRVTIDIGDAPTAGTKAYPAQLSVAGYDDVWVSTTDAETEWQLYATVS